jgi:hypothetical protein
MECEKVRDQFSSLLEKELSPMEERIVREHLASCPECQRDLEQFDKILHWLHSTDQVEVPEGFLSEILEKVEAQKRKGPMSERGRWRWFDKALSLKLPIQAMAMIAVVFLVLYITITKNVEQVKPPHSEAKKTEPEVFLKEVKKEKVPEQLPLEADGLKQIKKDKPIISEEKEEEKKLEGVVVSKAQPSEPEIVGKMVDTKERVSLAAKPPQEIILKVSDQGKILSRLNELVKQFGGEIVSTEGNIFLASLPVSLFSEFEKGLSTLSSPEKPSEITPQKDATEGLSFSSEAKRREIGERHKLAKSMPETEGRIVVRIVLLEE